MINAVSLSTPNIYSRSKAEAPPFERWLVDPEKTLKELTNGTMPEF